LLYADDLLLITDSEEILMEMFRKWKVGLEQKGLKVNREKNKMMKCEAGSGDVINET